jgi:release factor glutamine methyltransferase
MNTGVGTFSVKKALRRGTDRLGGFCENPNLDAQVLLAHILGQDKSWLFAHHEYELSLRESGQFNSGIERLANGEPLPYVLGEWEFYGLKLQVSPDVLIPRPETELLVETAQEWLAANPGRRVAADIGTGSGCIPVALAMHVQNLHMIAADVSADALDVARRNAQRYFLDDRIHLMHSNLMENVPGPFSLITANLPYIPEARLPELAVSKWEPRVALGGGEDGLEYIRPFLQQASTRLAPGGLILAEIDASLELDVLELAKSLWPKAKVEVHKDLAGLPRMLKVQT